MTRRRIGLLEFLTALGVSAFVVMAGLGVLVKGAHSRSREHMTARLNAEATHAAELLSAALKQGATRQQSAQKRQQTWTRPMNEREREVFACAGIGAASTMSLRFNANARDLRREYACDEGSARIVTGFKPVASHIDQVAVDEGGVTVTARAKGPPAIGVRVTR